MKFPCPHCQHLLETYDSFAGATVNCPTCGEQLVIPATPPPTAQPEPPVQPSVPNTAQETDGSPKPESNSFSPSPPPQPVQPQTPKAAPHFRIVFVPQPPGIFPSAPAFPGAARPTGQLSVTMLLVCLGISFVVWLVGLLLPSFLWIASIGLILSIVSWAILHYKCWKAVPAEFARLTPGKAVGFLFIPFFSFYWVFPSIAGLGSACKRLALSKEIEGFDQLSLWGLAAAILNCLTVIRIFAPVLGDLVGLGGLVALFFFYWGVTALLNGLAESENT